MFKIWNTVFGWDYIQVKKRFGDFVISRIHNFPSGVYYKSEGEYTPIDSSNLDLIYWLTCKPEKYIKNLSEDENK